VLFFYSRVLGSDNLRGTAASDGFIDLFLEDRRMNKEQQWNDTRKWETEMVGERHYFFVYHKSHMDYCGIEPGTLLEYPPTKPLSQAANAVPRQPKDRARFHEVIRLPLCAQVHFQNRLFCGIVVDSMAPEQDFSYRDNLDFPLQLHSTFI